MMDPCEGLKYLCYSILCKNRSHPEKNKQVNEHEYDTKGHKPNGTAKKKRTAEKNYT